MGGVFQVDLGNPNGISHALKTARTDDVLTIHYGPRRVGLGDFKATAAVRATVQSVVIDSSRKAKVHQIVAIVIGVGTVVIDYYPSYKSATIKLP